MEKIHSAGGMEVAIIDHMNNQKVQIVQLCPNRESLLGVRSMKAEAA